MKIIWVLTLVCWNLVTLKLVKSQDDDVSGGEDETEPIQSSIDRRLSFTFSSFSEVERDKLKCMSDADVQGNPSGIELTPAHDASVDGEVKGKAFYKHSIEIGGKAGHRTVSFSTSFTFVIKSENNPDTGDGLAFVLAADPSFEGDGAGQFNIFKAAAAPSPTVAVEFDTFMNDDLMDMDANHVGVDINSALSLLNASASTLNIELNDGRPVTAWIDYSGEERDIQVRISNNTTKPEQPLIKGYLDLSLILSSKMWVGFSASTHILTHQSHAITYWTFECESLHIGGNSLLEKLRRFWKTSSSYAVVAVGAAVVVLLVVSIISCSFCCPCCKRYCPCSSTSRCCSCCCCCSRWCPCHMCRKTHSRQNETKIGDRQEKNVHSKFPCLSSMCNYCSCSRLRSCTRLSISCPSCCRCPSCTSKCCRWRICSECFRGRKTPPPEKHVLPDEGIGKGKGKGKEKPCPLAFLEMIQEDVSQEKDTEFALPESLKACFPVDNPFSTDRLSSLLFGAESDDGVEGEARPAAGPSRPLDRPMMVSNTVFDTPPEEVCPWPEHGLRRDRTSWSEDCVVAGDNCLIERNSIQQQRPETPPRLSLRDREGVTRSRETESVATASYDYTPEEQIAMGWGYFST